MKTSYQLMIFYFLVALASCNKGSTVDTPKPVNQVQLPDTIVHFMLANNPLGNESYAFYFPDTVPKDRIEFYYIDSSHSSGFGHALGKYHVIYDYDPVTEHLVHASSRLVNGTEMRKELAHILKIGTIHSYIQAAPRILIQLTLLITMTA